MAYRKSQVLYYDKEYCKVLIEMKVPRIGPKAASLASPVRSLPE